jgi:hypothetical protein
MFRYVLGLLPALALAQLTPNSLTVTASRVANTPPDQVVFQIAINTATDATTDEVLAATRKIGLSEATFNGVSYSSYDSSYMPGPEDRPVAWSFSATAPSSELKGAIAALSSSQQSLAKEGRFRLSFSLSGLSASVKSQQGESCPLTDLIADARGQAAKLAAAAAVRLGSIQAISSPTITAPARVSYYYYGGVGASICSITVKFGLGGV